MPHPVTIRPSPYRPPAREQIERARSMYEQGFAVSRILAHCDMALGTLYYWVDGGPREAEGPLYPPLPRRRKVVAKRRKPLQTSQVSLSARLWRTAERQARDIEERLARPAASTTERERDVRMFNIVVRSMRDLALFDAAQSPAAPLKEEDDDPVPKDIDQFRYELARRIRGFLAERKAQEAAHAAEAPGASAPPMADAQSESAPPAADDQRGETGTS